MLSYLVYFIVAMDAVAFGCYALVAVIRPTSRAGVYIHRVKQVWVNLFAFTLVVVGVFLTGLNHLVVGWVSGGWTVLVGGLVLAIVAIFSAKDSRHGWFYTNKGDTVSSVVWTTVAVVVWRLGLYIGQWMNKNSYAIKEDFSKLIDCVGNLVAYGGLAILAILAIALAIRFWRWFLATVLHLMALALILVGYAVAHLFWQAGDHVQAIWSGVAITFLAIFWMAWRASKKETRCWFSNAEILERRLHEAYLQLQDRETRLEKAEENLLQVGERAAELAAKVAEWEDWGKMIDNSHRVWSWWVALSLEGVKRARPDENLRAVRVRLLEPLYFQLLDHLEPGYRDLWWRAKIQQAAEEFSTWAAEKKEESTHPATSNL